MSLVDTTTGEVAVMSERDARELIDSLRTAVEIAERQIIRAWQGRAWLALGYESWDEMIAQEFHSQYIKIAPDDRRAKAIEMAKVGMSTRAIGSALGVSHTTVERDLTPGTNVPPGDPDEDDAPLHSIERPDLDEIDDEPEPEPPVVTGLDGKSYPKPKTPKPRRAQIADEVGRAANDLLKFSERIDSIVHDERFARERDELAAPLRNQLINAIESLQRLLDQLPAKGN